ncbi:MAG: phosphatidylinositol-specific phospholipase C1-like protein [Pseudoxanthomonas sp.]
MKSTVAARLRAHAGAAPSVFRRWCRAAALPALILIAPGHAQAREEALRMNDLVAIGTHNSYKLAMPAATMGQLRARDPTMARTLDYAHRPLVEQLDRGARQLELDVNYDPQGGYYAGDLENRALQRPGFKVLHMAGLDNASSCLQLTQCLRILRDWSDAHPGHVPILLMFNAKDDQNARHGGIDALRFTAQAFDALDAEIRSVLPPDKLITPDQVQGDAPTLRDAVLTRGWPLLAQARGRFILALDEGPAKVALYRGARHSLEGRACFVNIDETSPAAAYLTLNDPIAEAARIRGAVAAGFLVRTRADADTHEARANDVSRRDAALAGGAQYISTDYLWAEPTRGNDYQVRLPDDRVAGCNPVRKPSHCTGELDRRD